MKVMFTTGDSQLTVESKLAGVKLNEVQDLSAEAILNTILNNRALVLNHYSEADVLVVDFQNDYD